MENKINIAELLKNCPKGMELDCTTWDSIVFEEIDGDNIVIFRKSGGSKVYLTRYGELNTIDGKCIIFPKGKTTWEGFVPPCKFKDGDVVAVTMIPEGIWIGIFKQYNEPSFESHCCLSTTGAFRSKGFKNHSLIGIRFATEEEKAKLFDAIKNNGYKWNEETKTLEKLPRFKTGNRIKRKGVADIYAIEIANAGQLIYTFKGGNCQSVEFVDREYELVSDKFDITTLVPFESRVLVRSSMDGLWKPAVFGFRNGYNDNAFYIVGGSCWKQCIPYLNNEHLCGTTNDCDEYYKTWK